MKFGEMKRDVDVRYGTAKTILGTYNETALIKEGKELYKRHPEYKYLEEDPWIEYMKEPSSGAFKDENLIYRSVVYAYMVDYVLKEHPELNEEYKRIIEKNISEHKKGSRSVNKHADQAYCNFNADFIHWYYDYLREQADPGILEREEAARKQKAHDDAIRRQFQQQREEQQLQQDLASGKRVVCPYCKSTDTEKIGTMSRAVSISLVGAASSKIGKQWHCKHCGSNF